MRGRASLVALAALVVLAFVVAIALRPRDEPASPTASPSPTAVASPSPSPTGPTSAGASPTAPSPTVAARIDTRYGIVTEGRGSSGALEPVVRSETDTRAIATLGMLGDPVWLGNALAVSPDGRRLAFWTAPRNGGGNRLELWEAGRPDRTATIVTSPSDEVGTGVVWSADGAGVLLSFESLARAQIGHTGGFPEQTVLRTLVLPVSDVSLAMSEVARAARTSLAPVAWDRERRTIAALETEGPSRPLDYLVIRDGDTSRTRLPDPLTGVRSSRDGRWVALDRAAGPPNLIAAWPADDPARVTELRAEGDVRLWSYGWLPGSTRVIVSVTGQGVETPLFLWDVVTGARIPVPGGPFRGFPPVGAVPRADGSGLYIEGEVLDLASGERRPLPTPDPDPTQHIVAGVLLR